MQIFVVDSNPSEAARLLCDKHVVKMPTESVQLLSAALAVLGMEHPYEAPLSRQGNPLTKWLLQSSGNFLWLIQHAHALCTEYTWRYSQFHKAAEALHRIPPISEVALKIERSEQTPFIQHFDKLLHDQDPIEGYRNLYRYKILIMDMRWTRRSPPRWVMP